jgi:hypothetical protein
MSPARFRCAKLLEACLFPFSQTAVGDSGCANFAFEGRWKVDVVGGNGDIGVEL